MCSKVDGRLLLNDPSILEWWGDADCIKVRDRCRNREIGARLPWICRVIPFHRLHWDNSWQKSQRSWPTALASCSNCEPEWPQISSGTRRWSITNTDGIPLQSELASLEQQARLGMLRLELLDSTSLPSVASNAPGSYIQLKDVRLLKHWPIISR